MLNDVQMEDLIKKVYTNRPDYSKDLNERLKYIWSLIDEYIEVFDVHKFQYTFDITKDKQNPIGFVVYNREPKWFDKEQVIS